MKFFAKVLEIVAYILMGVLITAITAWGWDFLWGTLAIIEIVGFLAIAYGFGSRKHR